MTHRTSIRAAWILGALWASLAGAQAQAPATPVSQNGGGKTVRQGVRAAFNPGQKDANGKVIPALPERRPAGDEPGPSMTEKGKADKALAEQHKAAVTNKPAPRVLPKGNSKVLPGPRASAWKTFEQAADQEAKPEESDFVGVGDTGGEPPDVAMAAGPNQIVAAANFTVNTWDKTGTLLGSQGFSSFFAPLGGFASWFIFDPVVTYDSYIGRFWLMATARNDTTNGSVILIALSNSQDPSLSGWTFWWVDFTVDGSSSTSNWCDYPHEGYDAQAIYITCNQFSFPASSGSFQYAKVRLMAKNQFLSNTCCSWWDHWNLKEGTFNLYTSFAVQPAVMRSAANSDGEFLVDAQGGGGSGSTLQVWHFPDPIGNPGQLDSASIGTTNYSPAPSAQQPSGVTGIDTGDARLLFANWQAGHLTTGQNSSCNNNSCVAFYEVNVSGFTSMSMVNDWALQAGGVDYYYPSVDQNHNSDKTMVYSRSSPSEDAGADFAGIPNSGACTLCFDGENSLQAGASTYSRICCNNRNRWGDYFSASADPDGLGIWVSGEFVQSQNSWATEIGATYNSYQPFDQPSTSALNFGNQLDNTSASQYVYFTNTGNANLNISSVFTSGTDFSQTNYCASSSLEPGYSCLVIVTFDPTAPVLRTGTLYVYDNAAGSPHTVSLSGTGTAPAATLTPGSLFLGRVPVGSKSAAKLLTLTNTGTANLSIAGITSTGNFTKTATCGPSLPPKGHCTISVTFAPTKAGAQTGSVTVSDNASPSTQTSSLKGTGTNFTETVSPSAIKVTHGQSATTTITVAPVDGFVGTVTLTCTVPSGKSLACSPSPTSLSINGSAVTSILTIGTASSTPAGTYSIKVKAAEGTLIHTTTVTLTVQ